MCSWIITSDPQLVSCFAWFWLESNAFNATDSGEDATCHSMETDSQISCKSRHRSQQHHDSQRKRSTSSHICHPPWSCQSRLVQSVTSAFNAGGGSLFISYPLWYLTQEAAVQAVDPVLEPVAAAPAPHPSAATSQIHQRHPKSSPPWRRRQRQRAAVPPPLSPTRRTRHKCAPSTSHLPHDPPLPPPAACPSRATPRREPPRDSHPSTSSLMTSSLPPHPYLRSLVLSRISWLKMAIHYTLVPH